MRRQAAVTRHSSSTERELNKIRGMIGSVRVIFCRAKCRRTHRISRFTADSCGIKWGGCSGQKMEMGSILFQGCFHFFYFFLLFPINCWTHAATQWLANGASQMKSYCPSLCDVRAKLNCHRYTANIRLVSQCGEFLVLVSSRHFLF